MATRDRGIHLRYSSSSSSTFPAATDEKTAITGAPTPARGEREPPPHVGGGFSIHARWRGLPKQTDSGSSPAGMGQRVEAAPAADDFPADFFSPSSPPSALEPVQEESEPDTATLHAFILSTPDADAAWGAYEHLRGQHAPVPLPLLRRLLALIGRAKPHRRVYFLRLLTLAAAIRSRGATLRVEEWNSIIACAARGQRRKRVEDYQAALDVFSDMLAYFDSVKTDALFRARAGRERGEEAGTRLHSAGGAATGLDASSSVALDSILLEDGSAVFDSVHSEPTITSSHSQSVGPAENEGLPDNASVSPDDFDEPSALTLGPDLQTYHILLHIAVLTASKATVRHATSLLLKSGFEPTWRTHAIMLPYFSRQNRLNAVRETVATLVHGAPDGAVDISVINACIWAYAREGATDVALPLYRALRSNATLRAPDAAQLAERERLAARMGFDVPRGVQPDVVTYRSLVQALAYHGDLYAALRVFRDFMQSPCSIGPEPGVQWDTAGERDGHPPQLYASTMPIYRSLFLGFARHGMPPVQDPPPSDEDTDDMPLPEEPSFTSPWTLDNFQALFDTFLQLDPQVDRPTERVLYWIIVALARTSGSDVRKMWHATNRIQQVFGPRWRGRLDRLLHRIIRSVNTGELITFPHDIVKRGGWRR